MDNQTLLWKADDNQIRENQLFEEHPDALEPLVHLHLASHLTLRQLCNGSGDFITFIRLGTGPGEDPREQKKRKDLEMREDCLTNPPPAK